MDSYSLHPKAKIVYKTTGKHHFFGYYDKSPWSADGKYLLSLEADFIDRLPTEKDKASIKVFDLESGNSKVIAETHAWNWQQGCMLQWSGKDPNRYVIYNNFANNQFVSVIFNKIDKKIEKIIPFPVYAVHPNGEYALSLNFSLIDKVREGYGYKGEIVKHEEGIYFVNLKTGDYDLVLSLAQLRGFDPIGSMNEGKHWIDHITFNPSGTRLVFLHRWQLKNGGMHSRLCAISFDLITKDPIKFPPYILSDSSMASHFTWKSDDELLVWARPNNIAASIGKNSTLHKLLVPIYHSFFRSSRIRQKISGDALLLFTFDGENYSKRFAPIGAGVITEDGHATFSPDKNWLLTDTYASKDNMRKLLLFNLGSKKLIEVGRFYALLDPKFGIKADFASSNLRCDLHPRWNSDGTQICIDSVHEGSRQVYVIDVSEIVKNPSL